MKERIATKETPVVKKLIKAARFTSGVGASAVIGAILKSQIKDAKVNPIENLCVGIGIWAIAHWVSNEAMDAAQNEIESLSDNADKAARIINKINQNLPDISAETKEEKEDGGSDNGIEGIEGD